MNRCIHVKSDNNNHYYFNPSKKEILLLHPNLYKILTSYKENHHPEKESYFEKKVAFLYRHNYFRNEPVHESFIGRIKSENIENYKNHLSTIIFSVTEKCNLKCKYCAYSELYSNRESDRRNDESLDIKKAFTLINYFLKYWNSDDSPYVNHSFYIGFYGGEPLLNFKFIQQVVEYCKSIELKNNNQFRFTMTTNALLLNKYIDFLVENSFKIGISLDGNEENNSYRILQNGKSSYRIVVKNINLIKREYPVYFEENVSFYAVLHNKNSFLDTYTYFKLNYNKEVEIYDLSSTGINPDFKETFNKMYKHPWQSLNEAIEKSTILKEEFIRIPEYSLISNVLMNYFLGFLKNYNELYRDNAKNEYLPTGTCVPFMRKVFVSTKGYILPCEKSDHKYKIGEVTKDEVVFYDGIIEKVYNEAYNKLMKKCKSCYSIDSCKSCIFMMDYNNSDLICKDFRDRNSFSEMIKSFVNTIEKTPSLYSQIFNELNYV